MSNERIKFQSIYDYVESIDYLACELSTKKTISDV